MKARHLVAAVAAIAVAASVGPAAAAPKKKYKPIKGSQKFTDPTADPTATAVDGEGCDTLFPQLPKEAGVKITIPAPGKLVVSLNNKGDWAIDLLDSKGRQVASRDGDISEPMEETLNTKIKKAGTYVMRPCNLGGEPEVTMSWVWTPA